MARCFDCGARGRQVLNLWTEHLIKLRVFWNGLIGLQNDPFDQSSPKTDAIVIRGMSDSPVKFCMRMSSLHTKNWKGKLMTMVIGACLRPALRLALVAVSFLWGAALYAQTASLPDYVVEEFGTPPAIPDGPLSATLQTAVRDAFVNSMAQSTWGRDQSVALMEIADSGDPRLVWLISDLMRFVPDPRLNFELSNAAGTILGKSFGSGLNWGKITDHLIAWDVPAPPDYLMSLGVVFLSTIALSIPRTNLATASLRQTIQRSQMRLMRLGWTMMTSCSV